MSTEISGKAIEVLLVEDNRDDVEFFVHTFEKIALSVRLQTIPDGAEALEYVFCTGRHARRNPAKRPKVIILDLKLPKVNGLEILRRLKADPGTRGIPVVVLSSSQEERDLIESYELGVNSYIVKPMDYDEFGRAVRVLCQYWIQFNHTPKR